MKSQLDARFNGRMDPSIAIIFNKISYKKRKDFNDLVSFISEPHINNIDWWVQGPSSRNTYSSPFFHNYSVLYLLSHLIKNEKFSFEVIIVDSLILKNIIDKLLFDMGVNNCRVSYKLNFHRIIKGYLKEYLLVPFLFLRKSYQLILAKRLAKSENFAGKEPLTFVDTFIFPAYIEDDRWYGSFWENLTQKQKEVIYFVPTIVQTSIKNMFAVYKSAQSGVRNFIFKESYLNYEDILFAIRHKSRIRQIIIRPTNVLGYDISGLIKEELNNNSDLLTVVESILTYRFIGRVQQLGIKINLAIDWFEGQSLDKAWNMGFHDFYPETRTIGYRPFEGFPFYLCAYPIPIERRANVLPGIIAVQGKGTISTVREFFPSIDVIVIPAFKAHYVWKYSPSILERQEYEVLVTLPISINSSSKIINRLLNTYSLVISTEKPIKFIIKPHPTHLIKQIEVFLLQCPKEFTISKEKSMASSLYSADVLITEASSTCLEAIACGVPVIMMENEEGLTYDSIPNNIPDMLYRKVRSKEQLINSIQYYIDLTNDDRIQQKIDSMKVRELYFEPISSEGVNMLVNTD